MLSRAATRTTTSLVTRRGFHATRPRMSSPYHYPEGPYSNLPFNPRGKYFGLMFWGFMATGFGAPFGISGACFSLLRPLSICCVLTLRDLSSLANLQVLSSRCRYWILLFGIGGWVVCNGAVDGRVY